MTCPPFLQSAKQLDIQSPSRLAASSKASRYSRRHFMGLLAFSTLGLVASDWLSPASARANSQEASAQEASRQEIYHIFIAKETARSGGVQTVTFRTGKNTEIKIPPHSAEGSKITVKGCGIQGKDAAVVLHTLSDSSADIDGKVEQIISTAAIQPNSQERCRAAYSSIASAQFTSDLAALKLLDVLIASSQLDPDEQLDQNLHERYQLASQNAKLIPIESCLEETLSLSNLTEPEKQSLRGSYQYVRAGEALPDVSYLTFLTDLDSIIQNAQIFTFFKQVFSLSSAKTRAFTVDREILALIKNDAVLSAEEKENYLAIYHKVRSGQPIDDQYTLGALDFLVLRSNLMQECKSVYNLARNRFFDQGTEVAEAELAQVAKRAKSATKAAAGFIPSATQIFSALGLASGTGTAISSLSGAAATNATLAALGGGSVAAGGLGMLGGLAVATGGAALIGAAALVSVSLVSEMDTEDRKNLGIAAVAGTLTSAATVGTAWAAISAFGAASSLSGAAAISATMAALGGVSVLTGGAALIAFSAGLGVWQVLKGRKNETKHVLEKLEPLLYTLVDKLESPLVATVEKYLAGKNDVYTYDVYISPEIPIQKVANTLSKYAQLDKEEKIIALVDLSMFNNAKAGIAFTNQGIWWNDISTAGSVNYSDPDYLFKIKHLPTGNTDFGEEERDWYNLALELGFRSVETTLKELKA